MTTSSINDVYVNGFFIKSKYHDRMRSKYVSLTLEQDKYLKIAVFFLTIAIAR